MTTETYTIFGKTITFYMHDVEVEPKWYEHVVLFAVVAFGFIAFGIYVGH